ncbi:MAG: cardiolipin synthase [Pirellulales bacterium]
MSNHAGWLSVTLLVADYLTRGAFALRVIMRRLPPATSLAWLAVILLFPFVGAGIYLMFGELRLGRRRAERAKRIHPPYERWIADLRRRIRIDWTALPPTARPLSRLAESVAGIPAVAGNALTLLNTPDAIFDALVADIDAAQSSCHLEFYIWAEGGRADEVVAAVERAAQRGVVCRVLLDAVGSKRFLASAQTDRLRSSGVAVQEALPVNLLRMLFVRFDLRLHRKIAVIDGRVAYTGSFNLVDPRFFKRNAGVGRWVDALVRLEGPAVEPLGITFLEDWELDTDEGYAESGSPGDARPQPARGASTVQVIPSGPIVLREGIRQVLLTAIYAAERELVLTTPYFVPDEPLLAALTSAAYRGVEVTLIVPERVDSRLVRMASRSSLHDLVRAGVRVERFREGLLHTKSVSVDGQIGLFGSLNLDPRSLYLNFEITLAVFDEAFAGKLRKLQAAYLENCEPLTQADCEGRPFGARLADNAARLVSPLL